MKVDALAAEPSKQRNSTVRIVSPLAQRRTRSRYTQDWLRNSNVNSKNHEKSNWWSDESDCSENELSGSTQVVRESDFKEAWSRLRGESECVGVSSLSRAQFDEIYAEREKPKVEQPFGRFTCKNKGFAVMDQRFSELLENQKNASVVPGIPNSSSMDSQQTTDGVEKAKTQEMEKALPPTPSPDQVEPNGRMKDDASSHSNPPPAILQSSNSGEFSVQRPRKRVIWRNKGCFIALPVGNSEDEKLNPKVYLTPEDVEHRIFMWRNRGYNTKGFSLTSNFEDLAENLSQGQSRVVFPDPDDWGEDRAKDIYRVSIPNRQEWGDYVRRLKEEKLRALGVSFGDEDASTVDSTLIPSMTRQASSQSSVMPISPLLTASPTPNLHGIQHAAPFLPPFPASVNLGSQMISHAIPASQQNGKQVASHLSRYSMGLSGIEHGFPPAYQLPQAQSPLSGTWSPPNYLNSQSGSRITSPATNGHMQSLGNALSPLPLSAQDYRKQGVNKVSSGGFAPILQQQAQVQSQLLQQQHLMMLQPVSTQTLSNPQNSSQESKSTVYNNQPEIFNPIPRGHRQNLSETLQKELDEAESRPGELRIPAKHQGESDLTLANGNINESAGELPILANILQNINGDFGLDGSDIDTNPSLSGTPKPQKTQGDHIIPHHSSKSSISKLNVNAREFEPKKPFSSEVFSFQGSQSASSSLAIDVALTSSSSSKHTSRESNASSSLNVAAPPFKPTNAPEPLVPSREFSFSSRIPAKPEASNFSESTGVSNVINSSATQPERINPNRIFSNVNNSEIIKPTKKSRAVPIMRPNNILENSEHDIDGQEDESGRITQPDGRQKRMRRSNNSGNEVPLFHEIPLPSETAFSLEPNEDLGPGVISEETVATLKETENQSKDVVDDSISSDVSSLTGDHEAVDADSKPYEPFSFHDVEDAAIFNAALSVLPSLEKSLEESNVDLGNILDVGERDFQKKPCALDITVNHEQLISSVIRNVERDSLPAATEILENMLSKVISDSDAGGASNASLSPLRKVSPARSRSASQSSASRRHHNKSVQNSIRTSRRGLNEALSSVTKIDPTLIDGVEYLPSYHEIDAVMKHLNEDDSDLGVERNSSPWRHKSPIRTPLARFNNPKAIQLLQMPQMRSDAPSPSPNRLRQPFQYLPESDLESPPAAEVEMIARNARFSPSYRPSKEPLLDASPVHHLNSPDDIPISDWDDLISSSEEIKFRSRTGFFDSRVNDVVGGIIQQRLGPLEKAVAGIQNSLSTLSNGAVDGRIRRSPSDERENSDADDEDEDVLDTSELRIKSPLKDRTYEKLKLLITETNTAQQKFAFTTDISEIREAVKELKASLQRPSQSSSDIKTAVEEAVARQMRGKSGPIVSSHESATVEKLQLQITGLESMLKIADNRADDELKARRATEDALADNQRLLRMAMQEAAEQRESAEETERSLSAFHDERQHVLRHTAMLEGAQESLQKTSSDLAEKNAALESTLAEYRLSSSQWRNEVEEAKTENKDLQRTINALKVEIEESIRGRQTLRTKFDRLQEDMTLASRDIARDQSRWRMSEEENRAKFELMNTKLQTESQTRERLEAEIMTLLKQEKENASLQHNLEYYQRTTSQHEDLIENLRLENSELQNTAARHERELHNAKEMAKLEIERTRTSAESDIETANNQVNIVSSDLQRVIAGVQNQLDEVTAATGAAKARYEVMLEEASVSKSTALREAAEAKDAALQEHHHFHERTLEDTKAQHSRALNNALEDKQRLEMHLNERFALAEEKAVHWQDKASHLEEKLEIAKSAAHAAALAAQAKTTPSSLASRTLLPAAKGFDIPEKISPQALRESIIVLQEQLQEREGRIEQLEQEASEVDKDAPARLKERDVEIVWLRELLGVRIDDLEDIIITLSKPSYNREAVKDAAIRLKANLQMEQQEKERALAGGQTFPSLASISNLASSPRALPLAAAAAWGNWRKARDASFGSISSIANGNVDETPSRSSPSSQSFLSGLLTPPSTKRQTSLSQQKAKPSRNISTAKTSSGLYRTPRQSLSLQDEHRPLRAYNPPATPPLMRKASYDLDADSPEFGDPEADENPSKDEPFGPKIMEFSERE